MDKALQRLLDFRYADFSDRHIFTTKLRLLIFLGYWVLVLLFFPSLLWTKPPIMLWISLTFLITTTCYHFILNNKIPYILFIVELMADVAAHTLLIYITGGVTSKLYVIYILYCLAGGLLYNWRVSAVIAVLAVSFYSFLITGLHVGFIQPFEFDFYMGKADATPAYQMSLNFILLVSSLSVAIYGNSIASYFNKQRERTLEERNIELSALNRIASAIRNVIDVQQMANEIVRNLTDSLRFRAALILAVNEEEEQLKVYTQRRTMTARVSARLGTAIEDLHLSLQDRENPVYQALREHKRCFSTDLGELVKGVQPYISMNAARALQREYNFRKIAAVPLIAERRLVGGLVAFSEDEWISNDNLAALGRYADQAALVLDNAELIEKLRTQNIELERVSQVKSEFLATMSHELRTPLTAIIGFTELLQEEVLGELTSDQKDSLVEVMNNAESLLQLINSLLDLAKIEAGKMELTVTPVSLTDIVQRVQRSVASLVLKKGQELVVESPTDLPTCYGDERKIQQTLLNLVSNAIKFTDEGGKIKVSVAYYPSLQDVSRWRGFTDKTFEGGAFEIAVSDTGVGIQEKDLEIIFESFRQVDSSFTRNYQGTGLGLALSHQFVQMHGGVIRAESQPGQGSTFRVLLPRGRLPATSH